jgi:hypothetical protein
MKLHLHKREWRPGREGRWIGPFRWYRLTHRVLAAVLACMALVDPLIEYAHEGQVRHAICLEHGKAVDLGQGQGSPAATDALLPPVPADDGLVPGQPGRSHEGTHCSLCPYQREETSLPDGAWQVARVQVPEAPLSRARIASCLPEAVPRLRLAPKNSPPA